MFGKVTSGMDVVQAVEAVGLALGLPLSPWRLLTAECLMLRMGVSDTLKFQFKARSKFYSMAAKFKRIALMAFRCFSLS